MSDKILLTVPVWGIFLVALFTSVFLMIDGLKKLSNQVDTEEVLKPPKCVKVIDSEEVKVMTKTDLDSDQTGYVPDSCNRREIDIWLKKNEFEKAVGTELSLDRSKSLRPVYVR
ncbi:hypothetical protein GGP94_003042 [Salinibacter ruber]|nr:hypothetical protein [Salinibacter ruber]